MAFPRGYSYRFHERFYRASLDYALPLAYPDLALGAWLFVKRFKGGVFYDIGEGKTSGVTTRYQSAGASLSANFHLLSLPFELDMGVRWAYRFMDEEPRVEVVVAGSGL